MARSACPKSSTEAVMTANPPRLGHFLDFDLWRDALKLLNYQIAQKKTNRHYNTLSMFYYERLGDSVKALDTAEYYEQRVASNLFYGLKREFASLPYLTPKSGLGLRRYRFLTYPMRALYYAVGLYLLKVSAEFLSNSVNRNRAIKSHYGGRLGFQKGRISLSTRSTYYMTHYKTFRNQVRAETRRGTENKIIIRLDIQNFYDEVSVPTLLEHLERVVKPSVKHELHYDAVAMEQITSFFHFLTGGKSGIPQGDNDIISGLIGYLYLVFADLIMDDLLSSLNEFLDCHTIIRYVDDIYISVSFKPVLDREARESVASLLAYRVADDLYGKLGLRLNRTKSRLYWLEEQEDVEALLSNLRKVSPEYYVVDDEEDEAPENKIVNIFHELGKLKQSHAVPSFGDGGLREEILREVFDDRVGHLLGKASNRACIHVLLTDFNFELVKVQPLELLILLLLDRAATERFRNFLLGKEYLTTSDLFLVVKFLCQTGFTDEELISKLEQSPSMAEIIRIYREGALASEYPGYHGLSSLGSLALLDMPHVVEQIRLRTFAERAELYSLALNHLLNEIQGICCSVFGMAPDELSGGRIEEPLARVGVPSDTRIKIVNLFDRRNSNQVSHPGQDGNLPWAVAKDEYHDYYRHVGKCLAVIVKASPPTTG